MRMLKVEMKRVLKTRLTIALLLLAFVLSFVLAWLPTAFSQASCRDAEGNTVELSGREAIRHIKEMQADIAGTVTSEKVYLAVEKYQDCLRRYGVESTYDLPDGVYEEEILPFAPLIHGVKEAFADPKTGMAPSVMEIDVEDAGDFYEMCTSRIASLMEQEQKDHPAARKTAEDMYGEVQKPYQFYPGYSTNALDYQVMLAFLLMLFSTVIASSVFTSDYQTGADDILRCTRYGRTKLAAAKILSAFVINGVVYTLCMSIYIIVSDCLFGWECRKTSIQMLYSVVSLPAVNVGQFQGFVAASGLLCILAAVCFTLFLSSKCRNTVTSLAIALLFGVLPIVLYMVLPAEIGNWIYSILPSAGTGLQAGILYAAIDFDFWNIGSTSIWLPHVMIGACAVEIPVFALLAVRAYGRRRAG